MPSDGSAARPPRAAGLLASALLCGACAALLVYGLTGSAAEPGAEAPARVAGVSATFVPTNDAVVVERLPRGLADPALRRLRADLEAEPRDRAAALQLARRLIDQSRLDADPRWIGQAEAALAPWRDSDDPQALLLLATVLQARHDFTAALSTLDRALALAPADAQGWLTRAAIEQVQGRYDAAAASCQRLAALGGGLAAAVCSADLASLRGDAQAAQRLERVATVAGAAIGRGESAETLAWLSVVQAEMAEREGRDADAERHFRQALERRATIYTRAAFADFLLARGRAGDALPLLRMPADAEVPDVLLLRQALALRDAGDDEAARAAAQELRERYADAERRGDPTHAREAARFALDLDANPAHALALAKANWSLQREPVDALTLARAARAAGDAAALDRLRSFVADTGLRDRRLDLLLASR